MAGPSYTIGSSRDRLIGIAGLTLAALIVLMVQGITWTVHQRAEQRVDDRIAAIELEGKIRSLDLFRTSQARLATTTGDPNYVRRYLDSVPDLEAAQVAFREEFVDNVRIGAAMDWIDGSNRQLLSIEADALADARAGRLDTGYAKLTGDTYGRTKAAYSGGIDTATREVDRITSDQLLAANRWNLVTLAGSTLIAGLLMLALFDRVLAGRRAAAAAHDAGSALAVRMITDSLTGLANRRRLAEAIGTRRAEGARDGALIAIELKGLRAVTDLTGAVLGDLLQRSTADRLVATCTSGELIARLDGGTFAVLIPDARGDDAERRARHIVRALDEPWGFRTPVPISVAAGVADERDADTVDQLLQRALLALNAAMLSGPSSVVPYEPGQLVSAGRAARRITDLQDTLAQRGGRLVPWFQNTVDLSSDAPVGMEALARWDHPTAGILAPSEWLESAEEAGLLGEIGWTLFDEAAAALSVWPAKGRPASIAINFVPEQLRGGEAPDRIARRLEELELEPTDLVVEITEAAMIEEAGILPAISDLRRLGVRVAVDDFGTGHSSLARLTSLPLDLIKIDRSITVAVTTPAGAAVIELVAALGRRLGLGVIAEGIETFAERDALVELGVRLGQGYLFHRPAPAPVDPEPWLRQRGLRQDGPGSLAS